MLDTTQNVTIEEIARHVHDSRALCAKLEQDGFRLAGLVAPNTKEGIVIPSSMLNPNAIEYKVIDVAKLESIFTVEPGREYAIYCKTR